MTSINAGWHFLFSWMTTLISIPHPFSMGTHHSDILSLCFPRSAVIKNLPANEGDTSSIPGSGRSPGDENSNPLQYSHLGNPMDRGACWATVHRVAKSWTQFSDKTTTATKWPKLTKGKIFLLWRWCTTPGDHTQTGRVNWLYWAQ